MQDLDYHSCIACSKSWISPHMKEQRVEFSRKMLPLRPKPDDWKDVRFSDEVHFVLEEDNDSGHTGAATTRWKKEHGIQYYLNAPKSSDLSPIENVWQPLKFHYNSEPHWDEERAKERILHAFEHKISQEWINQLV